MCDKKCWHSEHMDEKSKRLFCNIKSYFGKVTQFLGIRSLFWENASLFQNVYDCFDILINYFKKVYYDISNVSNDLQELFYLTGENVLP